MSARLRARAAGGRHAPLRRGEAAIPGPARQITWWMSTYAVATVWPAGTSVPPHSHAELTASCGVAVGEATTFRSGMTNKYGDASAAPLIGASRLLE